MRADRLDIRVPRNGDYHEGWQLHSGGEPIDLTGCTLELFVRYSAGQGLVLSQASFDIYDRANGKFDLLITGSAFGSVPGPAEIVRLAYDIRLTYPDGVKAVPVAGQILLTPGATY
ncbi:hypothetical protein HH800_05590 [Sphingobium yanoikuyae]|uniref:Uncharacterized protein n=1 Tax=Sphingobium yanoikuyae TaxID=13690 RepID=A0A6M4G360_SPHYA|nr:hypothetical protein [Sphingobium yanoikuyae]QJR01711.1 hypothetical protein HH800_05590 [Sphingobium yanoikuyae]